MGTFEKYYSRSGADFDQSSDRKFWAACIGYVEYLDKYQKRSFADLVGNPAGGRILGIRIDATSSDSF